MNFDSGTAYADSDADDEYERDLPGVSPTDANNIETSPIDSELLSNENTPTTYGFGSSADRLPGTNIIDWTAEESADFITTVGLQQYSDRFIENEIVGEALVALQQDDLKSMGINSVGHRLTILKSVFDVKKAQDVAIESDHYMPMTAETEAQSANATLKDIKNLVEQLRLRDERMSLFEQDMRKVTEDFKRLREDMLPALRLAKDAAQPLPNVNGQNFNMESTISLPVFTPSTSGQSSAGLKRQYSTKRVMMGTPQKANSPSYLQTAHDRSIVEQLDPSSAAERAVLSSSHFAALNGQGASSATSPSYGHANMPSPTSPPSTAGGNMTLGARSYRSDTPTTRSNSVEGDQYNVGNKTGPPRRLQTPVPETPGAGNASVEIFKSFRVSMDDPCYKVLPAALRKYQINAPPDQYALYIVYGDQERCLELHEKPLILFKQLDKEGKKPMFMLRKQALLDSTDIPGIAGSNAAARGGLAPTGHDPPGGII